MKASKRWVCCLCHRWCDEHRGSGHCITDVVEAGNTVRKPHVQQRVTVLKRLVNHRAGCVLPDRCIKSRPMCCHFWQPAVSQIQAARLAHRLLRAIVGRVIGSSLCSSHKSLISRSIGVAQLPINCATMGHIFNCNTFPRMNISI